MRIADVFALLNEIFSKRSLDRQPEPTAAMDTADQIASYTLSAETSGSLAGAYCWQAARITQAIVGRKNILDLGCASGVQLAHTASLNPNACFTGIDLATGMLEQARISIGSRGLGNVVVRQADMTELPFPDKSFDAVVSTMAFHHLNDLQALRVAMKEIARVLMPGGAVYISDLLRPRLISTMHYLSRRGNDLAPEEFISDYAYSLRASYTSVELSMSANGLLPDDVKLRVMRPWAIMGTLSSRLHHLPNQARAPLQVLRGNLNAEGRETLFDLRMGNWWNGPDPFIGISKIAVHG